MPRPPASLRLSTSPSYTRTRRLVDSSAQASASERAGGERGLDGAPGGVLERHAAVPPTVSSRMRTCGWPTPAGTVWPALPQ